MAGKEPRQWGPGSSAKRSPDSRSQQFTLLVVHPKKRRSQDGDSKEEPENLDSRMEAAETEDDNKIKDILDDILDLKDQMKPQQGQLAYLLYHEADRQRADSAGKIMVKNWWQDADVTEKNIQDLIQRKEAMITSIATEAGISERGIAKFKCERRNGKYFSPFAMIDTGNYAFKHQNLGWVNQKYTRKGIPEWSNDKLKDIQENGNSKDSWNGFLRLEPCVSALDRMQTEPLKAVMAAISKMTPHLQWQHSWKHLSIQDNINGRA